jgi:hypothetical protein
LGASSRYVYKPNLICPRDSLEFLGFSFVMF